MQHFYKRVKRCYTNLVQQCYTNLHTSIATSRCLVWRHQGTFLYYYYNTVMETCNRQKEKYWVQSLRILRHRSMQILINIATYLLREKIVHHLKRRSQPCNFWLRISFSLTNHNTLVLWRTGV